MTMMVMQGISRIVDFQPLPGRIWICGMLACWHVQAVQPRLSHPTMRIYCLCRSPKRSGLISCRATSCFGRRTYGNVLGSPSTVPRPGSWRQAHA